MSQGTGNREQGTGERRTDASAPLRSPQNDAVGGGALRSEASPLGDAPRPDPKKRPDKKKTEPGNGFAVKYIYPILWWICRIFLPLYHWPSFQGRENLPEGPCVICGNHSGFADPLWVFLLMKTRMPPWTMARKSLFEKPVFGSFLASMRAFPVDRDNVDVKAIKKSLSVLKNGEKLLIFPEGTRIKKGKVSQPKSGAVLLAQRAGVPLVPVYITHGRKPFQPIKVVMGEAYTPAFPTRRPSNEELEQATTELMAKVYALGE